MVSPTRIDSPMPDMLKILRFTYGDEVVQLALVDSGAEMPDGTPIYKLDIAATITAEVECELDAEDGDNVFLKLQNEAADAWVGIRAIEALYAMLVGIERIRDSDGNEAKINGGLEALQVDVKTAALGWDGTNWKMSIEALAAAILGQDVMANSLPVTIASDQSPVDVDVTTAVVGYDSGRDVYKFDPIIDGRNYADEDTSFVAGDSPHTIDVNANLGRNGRSGYIIIDGDGDILVEISDDGASWGTQFTMKKNEVLDLNRWDVDSIRLTHSGADSAYRAVVV